MESKTLISSYVADFGETGKLLTNGVEGLKYAVCNNSLLINHIGSKLTELSENKKLTVEVTDLLPVPEISKDEEPNSVLKTLNEIALVVEKQSKQLSIICDHLNELL